MSLSNKTKIWVQNNFITPEQREQILSFEKSKGNSAFWNTAFIIAGCLIGLGICLLVAANWSNLSSGVKLTGAFLILGGFIYGVYQNTLNGRNGLKELFSILSFLMTGAIIGLAGQIFHLSGGWRNFALSWAVLSLPFVLLSRSSFFNMFWLCILLSAMKFDWLEEFMDYIWHSLNLCTVLFVAGLYLIHTGMNKLHEIQGKYIYLPHSAATLSLWAAYLSVAAIGILWGLDWGFNKTQTISALYAHTIVFGFLAFRMYMAVRTQDIKSFKRNAVMAEIYIFLIFASKMNDLWLSGFGFIGGGLLILLLIWALRKTTKFIKNMEAFK